MRQLASKRVATDAECEECQMVAAELKSLLENPVCYYPVGSCTTAWHGSVIIFERRATLAYCNFYPKLHGAAS